MKNYLLFLSCFVCASSAFALPDYEPFAPGSTTSYNVGSALIGQTDGGGQSWFQAGPASTTQPTVASGDLTISGLASAYGGRSAAFGGNGESARLNMSVGGGGVQTGTVYYSMALKLTDLTVLNTTGVFISGFNNAQGAQTSTPNTVVSRLEIRSAGSGFNIGIGKGSGTSSPDTGVVWDSATYTTADTIFVVGSYTFNTSTASDDVAQIWINPSSTSFGAVSAPGGALVNSAGSDIVRVASLTLYDRSTAEPTGQVDEIRIGTSWADVTPVPEPATIALSALGLAGLCFGRFLRRTR